MSLPAPVREPASFRDPSGFVFRRGDTLFRQVEQRYGPDYDRLVSSGLYQRLVDRRLLVPHEEVAPHLGVDPSAHRILRPEPIPFVSYPHEWCFSQLRDAALLTLEIQRLALDAGMVLKDASAFNVQFRGAAPVFVDTLSFERWTEGRPWAAYRQFCQHFLAPLALMAKRDARLSALWLGNLDGVPVALASRLLPWTSWLRPSLLVHLHLHARAQQRYASTAAAPAAPATPGRAPRVSKLALEALADALRRAVEALRPPRERTEWGDYYQATNYSPESFEAKKALVGDMVARVRPSTTWDLGANTGELSRIAAAQGSRVVAFDVDPGAVERHYRHLRGGAEPILPLALDLTNPSPGHGWAGTERKSLFERGPADLVMALALVHHLAISNNVPLPQLAALLAGLGRSLIVEFVPKEDSQVARLLRSRPDVFPDYHRAGFEEAFRARFTELAAADVPGSARRLYLFQRSIAG